MESVPDHYVSHRIRKLDWLGTNKCVCVCVCVCVQWWRVHIHLHISELLGNVLLSSRSYLHILAWILWIWQLCLTCEKTVIIALSIWRLFLVWVHIYCNPNYLINSYGWMLQYILIKHIFLGVLTKHIFLEVKILHFPLCVCGRGSVLVRFLLCSPG
jgi:hypothetical protein